MFGTKNNSKNSNDFVDHNSINLMQIDKNSSNNININMEKKRHESKGIKNLVGKNKI